MNNAGISHAELPGRSFEEVVASGRLSVASLDEVRTVFETNVFGVIAVTQAMLPLLREAPAARIVNVASSGGSLTLNSDPTNHHRAMFGTYSASKAAANAVTVAFAADLEATGIKVNAACPGFTATDLNNFRGTRTVEQAVREPVRLALIDAERSDGHVLERGRSAPLVTGVRARRCPYRGRDQLVLSRPSPMWSSRLENCDEIHPRWSVTRRTPKTTRIVPPTTSTIHRPRRARPMTDVSRPNASPAMTKGTASPSE